jgi:inward rectifier potassium channel
VGSVNRPPPIPGQVEFRRIGGRRYPLSDFYHTLMRAGWPVTFGVILGAFVGINVVYALVYVAIGGVHGVRPGNFEDCFFFSVQTLATIGYGTMVPATRTAHLVVTLEAFTGILVTALTTGLLFAKFSRPTARVLFSRNVVIAPHDGKPTLMFRLANERGNRIVQASVRVSILRETVTAEGMRMRRLIDLKLQRADSAMFQITWTVFHTIDESSPLFGATAESLAKEQLGLVVTLIGLDDTLSQTVHARYAWTYQDFLFDRRFVDVITDAPDGSRTLDLRKFHDTLPLRAE